MTSDEKKLGEIALKKLEAQEKLAEYRSQLKSAALEVDLPVTVHLGGQCVVITPPLYYGGIPQCKAYRSVYE